MSMQVKKLKCGYGKKTILNNVEFEIKPGKISAVLGTNGSGKTTLMKTLLGILPAQQGEIFCQGKDLLTMKLQDRARFLAYVAQQNQVLHLHVYEMILMGRIPHIGAVTTRADYEKVEQVLDVMNLNDLAQRHLNELSGGEFQKVVLARALVQDTPFILLDEPTSALDIRNRHEVMTEISRLSREMNLGVMISLHDMNLALRYADDFLLLKQSEIQQKDVVNEEMLSQVYGVQINLLKHGGYPVAVFQDF